MRSVLVAVEADLPLVLGADTAQASAAIRFTPATCEGNVLARDQAAIPLPDGRAARMAGEEMVDLPVSEDVRARLEAMVRRACG